ncbi:MAG: NAD-dependent epimerase/dehydratase family protein [Armatimonadetes bacterium]|nr:NAD-dependent epimerase/dehydratase family protein [Armatimonadota bacterium]
MRYFVTGATGFIGGRVARQLAVAGHEVRALVRDPKKAADLAALGIRLHRGDITERASLREPMSGVDGVFHIAGWYKIGARDRRPAERINVEGTRNVLEVMRDLGIPKGVYTSTLAVFSDTGGRVVDETYRHDGAWLSEYDRTKWAAHYEVAEPMIRQGLQLVIVQPGMVYGPGDTSSLRDSFVQYLRGRLPMTPQRTAMCWAHVDDTARGHLLAMEKGRPGESYIIAGPAHTLRELFELAEQITGIPAPKRHPSPATLRALARVADVVGSILPLSGTFTREGLRVIAGVTYLGSSDKASRELGFTPRSLAEGLRETLTHEMALLGLRQAGAA